MPYLTVEDVRGTVAALAGRSVPRSVLVVNYQSPSWVATWGRWLNGWSVRIDEDLLAIASRIESTTGHAGSLANGRVVVAERD